MSAPRSVDPADLLNPLWNIYGVAGAALRSLNDPRASLAEAMIPGVLKDIQRSALIAMRRAGVAFPEGAELPEGSF